MGCIPVQRRDNGPITQLNRIRGSKTFTQSTLSNSNQLTFIQKERQGSSKQAILKTMRKHRYDSIKTIKSFIKMNISKDELENNVKSIENVKEKEQLLSIISEMKHFTFAIQKQKQEDQKKDEELLKVDGGEVNMFIHRIYDLNSNKSDSIDEEDDEDDDGNCRYFINVKSKSAEETPIGNLPLYQSELTNILENDSNDILRLSIIKEVRTAKNEREESKLFHDHIYSLRKKMMTLDLKQIMLVCFQNKQIKADPNQLFLLDGTHNETAFLNMKNPNFIFKGDNIREKNRKVNDTIQKAKSIHSL